MIYLMGTDGSGKTTLANNFYNKLKIEGKNVKYLYARYRPFFITPVKLLSKVLLYKKNTEFKNYEKYSEIKTGFSTKYKLQAKIYAWFCIIDYVLITWPLVMFKYFFTDYLIVDRYLGDLIVILSVASNLTEKEMLGYLRRLHKVFPKPTLSFFIDVDINTAYQRKDDIPSIKYLEERKSKYFTFQRLYDFKVLDGAQSKQQLVDDLYHQIFK